MSPSIRAGTKKGIAMEAGFTDMSTRTTGLMQEQTAIRSQSYSPLALPKQKHKHHYNPKSKTADPVPFCGTTNAHVFTTCWNDVSCKKCRRKMEDTLKRKGIPSLID